MKGRYACLLYDTTMKTVLGTANNEALFIDIIELLLPGKHIAAIELLNKEYNGLVNSEKRLPSTKEFPHSFMEDPLLNKLAQAAELANLPIEKLQEYEANMRTIIDVIAERTYAEEQGEARGLAKGLMQGREEGREEKAQAIAAVMLKDGVEPALVAKYTGLTLEQLEALKDRP